MKQLGLLFLFFITGSSLIGQDEGTLHFGPYARAESNLYKYLAKSDGTFSSIRASNGYSAGLELNAVLHYLVKVDFRMGFSEMNFSPNYTNATQEQLYQNNIRAVQIAGNVHLRLGKGSAKFYPTLFLGAQVNATREVTLNRTASMEDDVWEGTRSFGTLGISGNFLLKKERILVKPELGMRLKFIGKRGWENSPNQIFAGVSVGYRLKK